MSIFDFFKKSPKKEPVKTPHKPSDSVETMKRRQQAAIEVLGIFQKHFETTFESHPASVLYAAAWLAGTSLYRSFGYEHEAAPGTIILSDKANDEWPKLLNVYLYAVIEKSRIQLNPKEMVLEIPPEYKPKKDIFKIQELFQDPYNQIMRKYGFNYVEGAQVGALICAIITSTHCVDRKDLEPKLAAGIVSMGLLEASKTTPPPLVSGGAKNKNTNRLVLGERDVAIQEALDNGGVFIDPNPAVLKMLEQGNIDPFMIYEQALKQQIDAKIPRIDFVKANVDQLLSEWGGKSHEQAPIHVRLMLWLMANADGLGYEKNGNSWVLKQ
jgi:hypothetical protein